MPALDPRVDADGWYTLDIDAMFERYMAGNQKTWAHDRSKSVGASEVFSCMRQLFFKKRGKAFGYKPDDDYTERWGATERGNIIEQAFVAPALTSQCPEGVTLHYAGADQITLIKGKSSATPDGLFHGLPRAPLRIRAGGRVIEIADFDGDCLGLEIKSIDPRAHLDEERAKHRGQSQVGMGLVREETEYKPTHWLILYFDASWLDNIKPFLVAWDESVYKAAKLRAPAIWQHDSPLDFVAEGKISGECDTCPFRQACGEAVLSEWATTDKKEKDAPEVIEALTEPVEVFLAAKADLDEATKAVEAAKQVLKDSLVAQGARKVRSDAWSISWTTQKGRETVDYKTAFAENGIDPDKYTKRAQGFDVLRVTPRDQNEGKDE